MWGLRGVLEKRRTFEEPTHRIKFLREQSKGDMEEEEEEVFKLWESEYR